MKVVIRNGQVSAELGALTVRDPRTGKTRRFLTDREEKEADKQADVKAANRKAFHQGEAVTVSRKWTKHWTFTNAPAPTKGLWRKLITEGGGIVTSVDNWGNVWIADRYDQMSGRGGFPVPARFVERKA